MKPVQDETLEELEQVARLGAKQLRTFFSYEGNDQRFIQRAKLGAVAISGFAKVRSSETNRQSVELALLRLNKPKSSNAAEG